MAYMSAMGECYSCKRLFHFNPERVQSLRVDDVRQPICETCMERANAKRKEMGLEPHRIMPGAYEPEEVQ